MSQTFSPADPPVPGLTTAAAVAERARSGSNALPERRPVPAWKRLVAQFRSPLVLVLLVALALDLALWFGEGGAGVPLEAIAIAVILVANAALGVWQEAKGEGALAKLRQLTAPMVWAFRDGALVRLPAVDLVPGDAIRLEAGDRVPADARLTDARDLALDESTLTGESLPVSRRAGDEVSSGTLVVRGLATAVVTRTGAASAMGRLATLLGEVVQEPTPLERRLEVFGRRVARWVIGIAATLAVVGVAVEGIDRAGAVVLFAVAVAVAAVPEGLPAILTATLALGVERMARRKAVVRRLSAVEALGSVTVVATDKTGTLTENRMVVRDLVAEDEAAALVAMAVANDADHRSGAGDPVDLALFDAVRTRGGDPDRLRADRPRQGAVPFDSDAKFMSVTVEEGGRPITYLKGAPEVLVGRAGLPPAELAEWETRTRGLAEAGLRVLALAREGSDGLELLGLVSLWDPPRAEVGASVASARAAGVRVVMITGDHPATAATVARAVGIESAPLLTGADLDTMAPGELERRVGGVAVFARVSPEHKLRIVAALQAAGEVVAVTGDGVNDAPALKRSDVGIAMGQRGSDVSREAADLVLLDDNFATIVAAIEEGRSIYENIQKFIRFLFSTNLSELLVVSLGALAAFFLNIRATDGSLLLPLTAAQLLWINLITDGAPALALGFDRNPGVMRRPPRDPREPLLDRRSLAFIGWSGLLKAGVALGLLWALPRFLDQSLEVSRTAGFVFMAAGQLVFAYPARRTELDPPTNPGLHLAVVAGFLLQALTVTVAPLMTAFDTTGLTTVAAVAAGVAVVAAWAAAEGVGRLIHGR